MGNKEKIDFVVTWLDSNDPEWQQQYCQLRPGPHAEDKGRFRNWDLFRYWFRAVEQYAPWVHKVFLVTNGKFPDWINRNNPKLVLVSHADFMPKEYLPTFNSCAIEMCLGRIPGLSEHFVYFNDDFYINQPTEPTWYFRNGLPCDCNAEKYETPTYNPRGLFSNKIQVFCNVGVLNYHFNRQRTVRQAPRKWYGTHLWGKFFVPSLLFFGKQQFVAFALRHVEQPMLRSVFDEIWEQEPDMCKRTCSQFREDVSLNPYIVRYWQFATNMFHPVRNNFGRYMTISVKSLKQIGSALCSKKIHSLCLNDTTQVQDEDFDECRTFLHRAFEAKFPHKSTFEL